MGLMFLLFNLMVSCMAFSAPAKIPTKEIAPGVHIPMAGLGTWLYNSTKAEAAVALALELGYTHIDTAFDYMNSAGIGKALAASGRPRGTYFITTKVEGGLNYTHTLAEHAENLKNLGLAHVDLLLVHFPTTMDADPKGSRAMRQEQWKAMEDIHKKGMARAIGVSHYCKRHLLDILEIATIKPAINQVEFHVGMGSAGGNATDDRVFMEAQGVTFQSFSPLCGPCCMGDTTGKCTYNKALIEPSPTSLVGRIAQAHNKSGAQVALRWQVQQGIPVIPKTHKRQYMLENIDLFDWSLTDEEMSALNAAPAPPVTGGGDGHTSGDCILP